MSTALFAALLVSASVLFLAPSAWAVRATDHGVGYLSAADGRSWLGSHRLSDNNLGLCLEVTKRPPEGSELTYIEGERVGLRDADTTARLAFIAREWLTTPDPDWAAAAQLATWSITGLGGHEPSWFAQRANEHQLTVLIIADQMRDKMNGGAGASRSVSASLSLALSAESPITVKSDLAVDFLSSGPTTLPPARHTGTLVLTGAVFDDGSNRRTVQNGVSYTVTPSDGRSVADISAVVDYSGLPYGNAIWVAKGGADVQTLLVPPAALASAHASGHATGISPLPFAPAVTTQASSQQASTGAVVSDALALSVREPEQKALKGEVSDADTGNDSHGHSDSAAPSHDVVQEWGQYRSPDGALHPVPVTIDSTLYGPLESAPAASPTVPDGTPQVCTVHTLAANGPGRYQTPECVLPSSGFYVWTEVIDPHSTPIDQGGSRIQPWVSPFGAASEVTRVVPPTPTSPPAVAAPPTSPPPPQPAPAPAGPSTTPHASAARLASTGSTTGSPFDGFFGYPFGSGRLGWWAALGALVAGTAGALVARVGSKNERVHRRRG
ncbi:hypothetical protein BH09ACT6_BH09ACT6_13870 [soil metagenome]